jgi:hypothetical protein
MTLGAPNDVFTAEANSDADLVDVWRMSTTRTDPEQKISSGAEAITRLIRLWTCEFRM